MQGLIFDIKHFAIHDGPGIRQTIFFKGCPLRCVWCHNPESWSNKIEEFNVIKRLEDKEFKVKETIGKRYNVHDLFEIIIKDLPFFDQSNGGVTFSGGEPMLQDDFIMEIASKCKDAGIHTLIDTCGHVAYSKFQKVNNFIDLYYYDLKHVNSKKHIDYTGIGTDLIIENLKNLIAEKKEVVLRIPIIPAFNSEEKDIIEILEFIKTIEIDEVHLLPYHEIGKSKYKRYNISSDSDLEIPNQPVDLTLIKKEFELELEGIKVTIEN